MYENEKNNIIINNTFRGEGKKKNFKKYVKNWFAKGLHNGCNVAN